MGMNLTEKELKDLTQSLQTDGEQQMVNIQSSNSRVVKGTDARTRLTGFEFSLLRFKIMAS